MNTGMKNPKYKEQNRQKCGMARQGRDKEQAGIHRNASRSSTAHRQASGAAGQPVSCPSPCPVPLSDPVPGIPTQTPPFPSIFPVSWDTNQVENIINGTA